MPGRIFDKDVKHNLKGKNKGVFPYTVFTSEKSRYFIFQVAPQLYSRG
jgi:hypothetical protein